MTDAPTAASAHAGALGESASRSRSAPHCQRSRHRKLMPFCIVGVQPNVDVPRRRSGRVPGVSAAYTVTKPDT